MGKLRFKRSNGKLLRVTGEVLASAGDIYKGWAQVIHLARTDDSKYVAAVEERTCWEGEVNLSYLGIFDTLEEALNYLEEQVEPEVVEDLKTELWIN